MALSLRSIIYHTEYSEDQLPSTAYLAIGSNIVPASYCVELTAEGMIFEGWYTTSTFDEGTRVIPDVTAIPDGITPNLYAKWSNANEGESSSVTVASKMTALADAIRAKTGSTKRLTLDDMVEAINAVISETPGIAIYAILYDDGELVFQNDNVPDQSRTLISNYNFNSKDIFVDPNSIPWKDNIKNIYRVSFRDDV